MLDNRKKDAGTKYSFSQLYPCSGSLYQVNYLFDPGLVVEVSFIFIRELSAVLP